MFPVLCFGQTAEDYFKIGESDVSSYDFNSAIVNFTKAIELDPYFHKAYNNRGLAQANLKDFKLAVVDFTKAIELWNLDAQYFMNRGLAKAGLNDLRGSIKDYTKAIELQVIYPSTEYEKLIAYRNRGIAKYESNTIGFFSDYKKACDLGDCSYYNELHNQGLNANSYCKKGETKFRFKHFNDALTFYNEAIVLDSNHSKAYYKRGLVKFVLKDYDGAIVDLTNAIEIKPDSNDLDWEYSTMQVEDYSNAYVNRGLLKGNLDDYDGAIDDYTKAIELDSNYASAYYNRGKVKEILGEAYYNDYYKACQLNENKCSLFEKYLKTYGYIKQNELRTACNLGSDSACNLWYEWSDNEAKSKKSNFNLIEGQRFYKNGKYKKAIKYFNKVFGRNYHSEVFHFKLPKNSSEVLYDFDFNEEARIYSLKGRSFERLNKIEDALSNYSKYIEIVENDNRSLYYKDCKLFYVDILRKRGDIFFKKKEFIKAKKEYEKIYYLNKSSPDINWTLIKSNPVYDEARRRPNYYFEYVEQRLIKTYLAIDDFKSTLKICDSSLKRIKTSLAEFPEKIKNAKNEQYVKYKYQKKLEEEMLVKFYKVICLISLSDWEEAEITLGDSIGKIKNLEDAKKVSKTLYRCFKKGVSPDKTKRLVSNSLFGKP
tara:strand:- start:103 stop:2061 length:1959 start_codon:yes stop_codon:yes gene_type:complete